MENRANRLKKNTIILGIGTVLSKCLNFVFVPLFSRWLSTSQYGQFDLYVSYSSIIMPFMTLSTTEALFRFLIDETDPDKKKETVTNTALINCIGSAVISILIFFLMQLWSPDLAMPFIAYLLAEVVYNYVTFYSRGIGQLNVYAYTGCINVIVSFLSVFVLVRLLHLGAAGMLYGYAMANLITAIAIALVTKPLKYCGLKSLNSNAVKKIVRYSWPMIPLSISWWVVNASDRTIINVVLGSSYNGIYAIANKIPNLCTTFFNAFNLSWQESVVLCIDDNDRDRYINSVYNKLFQIIVSICLPIMGMNYFLFKYIFSIEYFDGFYQVPILMVAIIFNVMERFIGGIFIALKRTDLNGSTTVVGAIINVAVHLPLVYFIGLYAASISTLVSFGSLFLLRVFIVNRKCGIRLKLNLHTWIIVLVFIVLSAIDYLCSPVLSCLMVAVGGLIFLLVNKEYIKSTFEKIVGILKKK